MAEFVGAAIEADGGLAGGGGGNPGEYSLMWGTQVLGNLLF